MACGNGTADIFEKSAYPRHSLLYILKGLVYKYAQYYRNPDAIIKCATYWPINGDNMILDEMLEKLRMIASDD
jgi:hypothetical protein